MIRARVLGALFALIALVGCNDSALPPGGTYQSVSGVVLDAVTNRPVAGAVVTIDVVLHQTTDAQGRFTFPQVPVGDIDYQVSAQGYKTTQNYPARVAPDKPLALTVTLSH